MTPDQHYQEAERLLDQIAQLGNKVSLADLEIMAQLAQIHATLATAEGPWPSAEGLLTRTTVAAPTTVQDAGSSCSTDSATGSKPPAHIVE